ncbi:MAG: biotin--[acetyl-CoA-carboxylase] ligase [Proteobacteria bacterium]|nr:MAG: biotin--[acetyl-CoA-carboxylase] ligase [Pseudomonadota bacterium]
MTNARRIVGFLAGGGFVSGEDMAARLGVSRAAVSQQVARLRDMGIPIHSVRGRGYRLAESLEPLDADVIRSALGERALDRVRGIELCEQVDSTNRYLADAVAAGQRVDVCLAEFQSAGRGRRGRAWLAAPYGSVLLSLAHRLPGGPAASAGLSLAAGVAVARAVERVGCHGVSLKWPNDLLLRGAKFGGILVEITGELGGDCTCIVGVGANVTLPAALEARCAYPVTSISRHAEAPVSRNALVAAMITELVDALAVFDRHGFAPFREEWDLRHAHRDRTVRVAVGDRVVEGRARGVADDGALRLVEPSGKILRITTGEVMA